MRVRAVQDKATGKWTGYAKGVKVSGWGSASMARHKAREYAGWKGQGGAFGGGYVKRGK